MTAEHLLDAIGNVDDSFIEEAAAETKIYPKIWIPAAALAACILLTTALLPWGTIFSNEDPSDTDSPRPGIATDVLQNEDTPPSDGTGEREDPPESSPSDSTRPPENSEKEDTSLPAVTPVLPQPIEPDSSQSDNSQSGSTEIPDKDETTDPEKETAGPEIPDKKPIQNPGTVVPPRPTVLSLSQYPVQDQYPKTESLRPQWRNSKNARISYYSSGIGNTDSFMYRTVYEFFQNSEGENLIYSPVNAYMTLGMLAETTANSSRAQLLGLLGHNDIYSMRSSANSLWNSCYRDDGIVTSVFGNSMWLDNSFTPRLSVTDILAENYYASSFYGNMGDGEYDTLMHSWINEQTRGALSETVKDATLDPESKMSLISTVYFKANWSEGFDPEVTRNWTFHSPDGDVTAPFMYKDFVGFLYRGTNFRTTCLDLSEGGKMWLVLPNEGVSPEDLFADREAMGFITGETQKTLSYDDHDAYMWLFLPKFSINSTVDLGEGLKGNGVTEIFDPAKADFSALTDSSIYIRSITQTASISIDENGCEAASASGSVAPDIGEGMPMGFALDRPFIFVVTSDTGIPMFVGTVNRPD